MANKATSDKRVIIGTGKNQITMLYGTGVKESPETSESTTDTFDGPVVQGTSKIAYTLEMSKLRYEGRDMHMKMSQKIEDMMQNKDSITVIDTVRPKGEKAYTVTKRYYGCINSGNDWEMKPEENTVENLKFKCESRETEWKYL